MNKHYLAFILLVGLLGSALPAHAQYFGRNKPRYQRLNFKVTETPHLRIYDYLDNPDRQKEMALAAELWYKMHKAVLRDSIHGKNPLVIYNDHAGFQQTNVIDGDISVGTGGVTEGLRNRVVFPIAMTNQQTYHVLGHELVHAFQYDMVLAGDSTNMQNLGNLPLWMVEGLAEYLSIGRVDPHTAMWMRDAVINNDVPRIRDLNDFKYFPYRWGQAFWAYITGVYGDAAIRDLFMNTAKYGLEPAFALTLGTTTDSLSVQWQRSIRNYYGQWVVEGTKKDKDGKYETRTALKDYNEKLPGKQLISDKNSGSINIGPVVSPNGKYVTFLSEKNLFSIDLFLADAKTGKIIRKISSTSKDGHIDQFNAIESAGTWAPDNERFAFDVYERGRSILIIKNALKGRTVGRIDMPEVPAFSNPAWSPDGKTIVVTGLVNGQTDLYAYDIKTKKVRRLTNDVYSEILPSWNKDGSALAFSTDRLSMQRGRTNGVLTMNLAIMDMTTGQSEDIDIFQGADNLNPQFDKGGNLLFLSNRDGFRNLYRYDQTTKKVYQMTNIGTGISGITPYAPALSVSEDRDRIVYTHFFNGDYTLWQARTEDFKSEAVETGSASLTAGILPPFRPGQRDVVNTNLRLWDNNFKKEEVVTTIQPVPYKSKFSVEYLGGGIGIGTFTGNAGFGNVAGLGGGSIQGVFGDILGNNRVSAALSANVQNILDLAGQAAYINQKRRLNWGLNGFHLPFLTGRLFAEDPDFYNGRGPQAQTTARGQQYLGFQDTVYEQRQIQQRFGAFTFFPVSVTKRWEAGLAFERYAVRIDEIFYYSDRFGQQIGQDRRKLPLDGASISLPNVNAAYVGDNSYFGMTAPLQGWRYRLGVEQYFGKYNFTALLADGRRYFRKKPFTLAVRGLSYMRMGTDGNALPPMFIAQPFLMRGFPRRVLTEDAPQLIAQMQGSKIAIVNAEIRLPLFGPRKLALIPFNFLPTDVNFFFDTGIAFDDKTSFQKEDPDPLDGVDHVQRRPLYAIGTSFRVNVMGWLILEPYYALPLSVNKQDRRWRWGLNIVPGW